MAKSLVLVFLVFLVFLPILLLTGCGDSRSATPQPPAPQPTPLSQTSNFVFIQPATSAPSPTASKIVKWDAQVPSGTDSVVMMKNDGSGETMLASQIATLGAVQISYDGKKGVATALSTDGFMHIYVVDIANTSNPVVQVTNDAEDHFFPQFSPDGKQLVFVKYGSDGNGQAELAPVAGGAETAISTPGMDVKAPSFTPDGKIVFEDNNSHTINLVHADGSGMTVLTNTTGEFSDASPSVSVDGKKLVFERNRDVYVADITGQNVTQLTTDHASYDPMFVNDKIVFLSSRDSLTSAEIYSMSYDGTNQKRLTTNENMEAFAKVNETSRFAYISEPASTTPTSLKHRRELKGQRHVFTKRSHRAGKYNTAAAFGLVAGPDILFTMKNDGTDVATLAQQAGWFESIQLSYDGKKVVFSADTDDGYVQIFVADIGNFGAAVQLTSDAENHWGPQFSRDGKQIVFTKYVQAVGEDQATLISSSGGAETIINTPDLYVIGASFAPDGRIVFEDCNCDSINIMNADGSGMAVLDNADCSTLDNLPSVSPDGTMVTFIRNDEVGDNVYTVAIDGSNQKQLTTTGMTWDPMFVNDKIVFLSWQDQTYGRQIYSMNPDGTNQKQLTTDTADNYFAW